MIVDKSVLGRFLKAVRRRRCAMLGHALGRPFSTSITFDNPLSGSLDAPIANVIATPEHLKHYCSVCDRCGTMVDVDPPGPRMPTADDLMRENLQDPPEGSSRA